MFMGAGFVGFVCFFLLCVVFDFVRFLGSSIDSPVANTWTRAAIALTPIKGNVTLFSYTKTFVKFITNLYCIVQDLTSLCVDADFSP